MLTKLQPHKKESFLTTILWWCSGVEIEVLRQLPSESKKYASIGISVFAATLLALSSGIYTCILVFRSNSLGILFGIMWGLLIFTLERYSISLIAKTPSYPKTFLSAIPSLLVSTMISLVISTPISVKFFEKQIQQQHLARVFEYKLDVEKKNSQLGNNLKREIEVLKIEIQEKKSEVFGREREYIAELKGTTASSKKGNGPVADFKRTLVYEARRNYDLTRLKNDLLIDSLHTQMLNLHNETLARIQQVPSAITFVDMVQALADIKNENKTINMISLLLWLTILLVYTAPIFIQILSRQGPYNAYVQIRDRIQLNQFTGSKSQDEGNELRSEVSQLKSEYDDINSAPLDKMMEDQLEAKNTEHHVLTFQTYFAEMINTILDEVGKNENKAKDFFWQGMVFSIIGILTAFGFLVFWINYFSTKRFEIHYIFELVSGTIIILLIEFLGAWFLKQYKIMSEKSLHTLKIKSILDRYQLIYLSINEFASQDKKETYLNQLLATLDKDLRFPTDVSNSVDTSFTQEAFSSISNLTDTIKSLTKTK